MIQCIQSSGWTGYVLMKVRQDFLEVGLVKVPSDYIDMILSATCVDLFSKKA